MGPAYFIYNCALGEMLVAASKSGITDLVIRPDVSSVMDRLARRFRQVPLYLPERFAGLRSELDRYFNNEPVSFSDRLDLAGSSFDKSVWRAVSEIPWGETRSYARVADMAGSPGGARACGGAVGRNPVPIIIPCHRVVRSDGCLGGYTGGLDIKRTLLSIEGVLIP